MNKITPHLIRDLDATLPSGTESYLVMPVRKALSKYRNSRDSASLVTKDHAIPLLAKSLGRGLKRFLIKDIRRLMPGQQVCDPEKFA